LKQSKIDGLEQALNNLLQGEASFSTTSRALYATAACMYKVTPAGVVYPKSTSDVVASVSFARKHGLSLTARGAGSSLVGQAVNSGLILDFSRYMNKILDYDAKTESVRVQPGVIYGDLNRFLKQYNRYFPPDPSSGEYCTLGGMVANNAAGSHSVKNGFTIDYLQCLEVVLHDGTVARFGNQSQNDLSLISDPSTTQNLSQTVFKALQQNKDIIEAHTPKVKKNASGYRLEKILEGDSFNLAKLFCGSEGTLGLITEISFKVKSPPRFKTLTIINFDRLEEAAEIIHPILKIGPSAIEMMEKKAMETVREYRPDLQEFYPEKLESQLYVEFDGDAAEEVQVQQKQLIDLMQSKFESGVSWHLAKNEAEQAELWKIRKASFPLVYQKKRPEKVPAFIEDYVVPPESIASFIKFLYEVYKRYGSEAMILGHAGNGNFHTRPFINFSDEQDLNKMHQIAEQVTAKVLELGGSLSGEHGDGRARAHLLVKQAGPLYHVYEEIKQLFDPQGMLNPDVKISRENQLTKNLRFNPQYKRIEEETLLHFDEDDYYYEIEKCHGCSACHQSNVTNTMCPLFQITGEELASPRGKADILQHLIAGDLEAVFSQEDDYKKMLDYCIYCEGCYVECPSHVDVGRLLQEHKARYRAANGAGVTQWLLEHSELLSKVQSWFAPVINLVLNFKIRRVLMECVLGIDRRRPFPKIDSHLQFKKNNRTIAVDKPIAKVVLFHDLYARYNDSNLTALAIKILAQLNVQVEIRPMASAAMPAVVYGNLDLARKTISKSVEYLADFIRKGYKVISTEPTAVLALKKEWKDVLPTEEVKLISENSFEFFDFIVSLIRENDIPLTLNEVNHSFGYHAPCHLKAMQIGRPSLEIMRQIPGVQINEIDRGCCGIAGTYGFKKGANGYDQSMAIGASLFEDLRKPENDLGLSECSTCRMQMEHGAGKQSIHPLQVLAESMGIQ